MQAKKPITEQIKTEIAVRIKNKVDISDLIENYDIKGLYLAGAIIKKINRLNEDLQNTNFVKAEIGEEGVITNLSGCNFKGSNFLGAKFLGVVWLRGCDLRNCNFNNAWLPGAEYQYSDLRNIQLCDAFLRLGSKNGFKAKFDTKMFDLLSQYLQLDLQSKENK